MAAGVHSFHRHLPLLNMRCDLFPERLAVWWSPKHVRLSPIPIPIPTPSSPVATVSKVERLCCPNPRGSRAVGYQRPPVTSYILPAFSSRPSPDICAGPKEYTHDPNFADPISGGVVEVFRSIVDFHTGIAQIFRYDISLSGAISSGLSGTNTREQTVGRRCRV